MRHLLLILLVSSSALAQEAGTPATLPVIPYHLTARPWQPTYVPASTYLDTVESIARVEATYQDATGAIIDPYKHREIQYSTPYFAASVAMLVAANRALDLLPKGVLAMERATWEIANGRANVPDDHGEFFVAAVTEALPLYASKVSASQLQTWKTRLQTPLDQIVQGKGHNWRTYAMKGEWLRANEGLVDKANARSYIERSWLNQQRAKFTGNSWNLYHDGTADPDTLVYEAVARGNLFAMLTAGYDGASRDEMDSLIRRGTQTALLMQDPSGQNPASGRSGNHTWSDVLAGNSFEQMAERIWKEGGDSRLAGQYRHAASLNSIGIRRWRRPDGSYSVTKNHFNPKLRVGYAGYSHFANYNGNVMFHSAESYRIRQSYISEQPAPAEIGGFTLVTDPLIANAFANAGGMLVQAGLRGSTRLNNGKYWTTLGLIRFGRVNWDSRLGPSDGIRDRETGLGVSFAPTFLENGNWIRLASVPDRYEAKFSVQFTHPLLVRCAIDYTPRAGHTGPIFRDELIITPDGVLSTVTGNVPDFGVTWPVLENDGTPLQLSYSSQIASTSLMAGGDQQSFIALQPNASILRTDATVRSSYGDLRPVRVTVPGAMSNETFIYPRNASDPSAEEVLSSFVRRGNNFSSILGSVRGSQYIGRTSAGGLGTSIDLNGDSIVDASFSSKCGFVLQLHDGKVTAVEVDRPVTASIQGRTINLAAYSPVSFATKLQIAAVSTSSAKAGYPGSHVLDADLATRWTAKGDGQWIKLDLGDMRTVSSLRLAWYRGTSRTSNFEVQYSTDGANWSTLIPRMTSSGSTVNLENYPLANIPARYLKIIGHGNSVSSWISLTEVQVKGF